MRRLVRLWAPALLAAACGLAVVGVARAAGSPEDARATSIAGTEKAGPRLKAPKGIRRGQKPQIAGVAEDGQLLSVNEGTWKGTPPLSFTYQWEVCGTHHLGCSPISGATASSYRVVSSQIGLKLRALVTATNAGGSASATSRSTKKIEPGSPVSIEPPAIAGSLLEGATLTANVGAWAGTAPFTFTYQWQRCSILGGDCEDIPGATSSTYTLGALDIASQLALVVTATNAHGFASATSAETSPILALLPSNTGLPSISGLLQDGQLLSVLAGSWSGSQPITYSYQWQLCNPLGDECADISDATGASLELSPSDIGGSLDVVVTATNVAGSSSVTTPVTGLIAGLLPSNLSLPSISGLLQEGQLLSVGTGSWSGSLPISYSYQWQLCNPLGEECEDISDATGSSLRLSLSDIGRTLDVVVQATNVAGSTSVTTSVSGLIEGLLPSNTDLPSISGLLQEGQLLSVATGTWSGSAPITYSYQWQLCNALGKECANISEATGSSLKLLPSEIGGTLDVVVKATNVAGSSSVTTAVTGLIAGILPSNTGLPSISGLFQEGQLLSVGTGSWSGTTPITYSYQWQLCNALGKSCSDISEATGQSLKLSPGDIGNTLDVIVKATNVAGSSSVTISATGLIEGILPSNTGLPSISGLLQEGQLLSIGAGTWSGTTPISYSYQWQLCNALGKECANIAEATGSSLKLLPSEIGSTLDVVVKATNVAGSTSVTTAVTGLVAGILPSNTGLPSVSGLLQEGQLLNVGTGSWSGTAPITYSYQWQLCNALGKSCANISEATGSSLKLSPSDIGDTLDVIVKATNAAGSSSVTTPVTGLIEGILPSNTVLPAISGLLKVGQLLTASTGTWSGTAPITYTYQWQLCNLEGSGCSNIAKATSSSFLLSLLDLGLPLRVAVTASNVAGSTSATSNATGLIEALL